MKVLHYRFSSLTLSVQEERHPSIRVHFKDDTYRTFEVPPSTCVRDLGKEIIRKMRYKRANAFKLYVLNDDISTCNIAKSYVAAPRSQ